MSNPVANMQQLVSHWSTLMPPGRKSKKRGRENVDNHRAIKLKTQDTLHAAATAVPPLEIPTNNAAFSSTVPGK
tara:strand:+ start:1720 stop:1941 length:222 start_codon:yes stop_codon:yes gene_type:complete